MLSKEEKQNAAKIRKLIRTRDFEKIEMIIKYNKQYVDKSDIREVEKVLKSELAIWLSLIKYSSLKLNL